MSELRHDLRKYCSDGILCNEQRSEAKDETILSLLLQVQSPIDCFTSYHIQERNDKMLA